MISLGATGLKDCDSIRPGPTECDARTGNGKCMADDYKYRPNRSNEPYRRGAEPPRASDFSNSSDPLAELARLIGQNDPFADRRRGSRTRARSCSRATCAVRPPPRDLPPAICRHAICWPAKYRSAISSRATCRRAAIRRRQRRPNGRLRSARRATGAMISSRAAAAATVIPAFGDYAPSRATGRDPIPPTDDYLAARGCGDRYASPSPYDSYAPQVPAAPVPREEPRWPETPAYADPHRYDEPASEQGPEPSGIMPISRRKPRPPNRPPRNRSTRTSNTIRTTLRCSRKTRTRMTMRRGPIGEAASRRRWR